MYLFNYDKHEHKQGTTTNTKTAPTKRPVERKRTPVLTIVHCSLLCDQKRDTFWDLNDQYANVERIWKFDQETRVFDLGTNRHAQLPVVYLVFEFCSSHLSLTRYRPRVCRSLLFMLMFLFVLVQLTHVFSLISISFPSITVIEVRNSLLFIKLPSVFQIRLLFQVTLSQSTFRSSHQLWTLSFTAH